MVATGRIQDLILNPEETGRITEVISEGGFYGMQTFDQSLLAAVTRGDVSEEVAVETASSPHDFKLMLAAQGQRASGVEQVLGNGDAAEIGEAARG
jgi:twitching motility protein PilT